MRCWHVRKLLVRYDDDDLPGRRMAEVRAHLDTCETCAAELAQLRAAIGLVESLAEAEPGRAFTAEVLAAIRSRGADERTAAPVLWPVGVALGFAGLLVSTLVVLGVLAVDWESVGKAAVALAPSGRVLLEVAQTSLVQLLAVLEPVGRALTEPFLFALLADVLLLMAVLVVWRRRAVARSSAGIGSMLAM